MFIAVGLFWLFAFPSVVKKARAESQKAETELLETTPKKSEGFNKKLLLLSIVMLAIYGVATNLIKDGLITWVPSILKEQYE